MNKIAIDRIPIRVDDPQYSASVYDIGVFFNSSESRALAYPRIFRAQSIKVAFLVNFDGMGNEEKAKNWQENEKHLKRIGIEFYPIHFESIFEYQKNLDVIAARFLQFRNKLDASKIFMDVTGVPLIYSVALTKFFFRLFPIPSLDLLNVSGVYSERGQQQFSEGERYDMYIPGYFGRPDHSKFLHYIFLLGYDGDRSLSIYRDNLPDKVSVIIPSPGYEEGNDENTIKNNRDLLIETGFCFKDNILPKNYSRNKNLYYIDVSDVEAVRNQIETIYNEDKEIYDIRLVPLGPKPHAIGAALAAVFNNYISIMYQVPKKYFMSEIPAGKDMWLYKLSVE